MSRKKDKKLEIYIKVVASLLEKGLIKSIFQLAVSSYDLKNDSVKYLYLALDIHSFFKYIHRLWKYKISNEDKIKLHEAFDDKFENIDIQENKTLKKIYIDSELDLESTCSELKKISISESVTQSCFRKCLPKDNKNVKSYMSTSLTTDNTYNYNKNASTLEWKMEVFLEAQLFDIVHMPQFLCVFFIENKVAFENKVYAINVFYDNEEHVSDIVNNIKSIINLKSSGHSLLENYLHIDQIKKKLYSNQNDEKTEESNNLLKNQIKTIVSNIINGNFTGGKKKFASDILNYVTVVNDTSILDKVKKILDSNDKYPEYKLEEALLCLKNT